MLRVQGLRTPNSESRTPNPSRRPVAKDHQLETQKPEQGGGWNGAEFGHQDIGGERAKANADHRKRHQPAAKGVKPVLSQLFAVIGSPAAKNPEFIQKEMARYRGQVRDADGHQRRQEKMQQPDERKVNDCDRAPYREEPDNP